MHLYRINSDYFTMTPNTYHLNECYIVEIFVLNTWMSPLKRE